MIKVTLAFMGIMFFLNACSKSTSSTAVSTLSALPAATGEVTTSAIVKDPSSRDGIQLFAAATGIKLSAFDNQSFWTTSSKSRPFCESGRLIREAYMQASEPDKILCYIKGMTDNGLFPSTVYDGNYQYYSMTPPGRPGGAFKIKFKVTKSGDAIQTFEMFMCESGTQNGYVSEDVTNAAAASVSNKFIQTNGNENSFASSISATGAINSSGVWSSKVLSMSNTSTFGAGGGTGSFRQKSTITQYADRLTLDAFMAGNHGGFTFSNQLYSVVQILNATSLATFALGDGSAKYVLSNGAQSFNSIASWLGDTGAPLSPATSGEQYATANAATVRTVEAVSVAYTAAETWDCSGTFETVNFQGAGGTGMQTAMTACNTKYGAEDRNFVECRSATGE